MFKTVGPQEARDEHGVTVEIDGHVLRYRDNSHAMEFGAQASPPPSPKYDALFTIYFPARLHWQPPHEKEPVGMEVSRRIEADIIDGLRALDCAVNFTLPMAS